MLKNQLYEHHKEAENEGISIWQYQRGRRRPQFLTSTLKSIPNFDSNWAYLII